MCMCVYKNVYINVYMWHKTVHLHWLPATKATVYVYRLYECIRANIHASVNVCVWVCVCFVHVSVWNQAWWVCFDRSELLHSRSAHWRDVPPVNGCSGAWPAWHSFEYHTHACMHTHTHTHTHNLASFNNSHILQPMLFFTVCDHARLSGAGMDKDGNSISLHWNLNLIIQLESQMNWLSYVLISTK